MKGDRHARTPSCSTGSGPVAATSVGPRMAGASGVGLPARDLPCTEDAGKAEPVRSLTGRETDETTQRHQQPHCDALAHASRLAGLTFPCVMWHKTMIMTPAVHTGAHAPSETRPRCCTRSSHVWAVNDSRAPIQGRQVAQGRNRPRPRVAPHRTVLAQLSPRLRSTARATWLAPPVAARRHGATPSISISKEKLRTVQITTMRPSVGRSPWLAR
jgi:hypothetical protein